MSRDIRSYFMPSGGNKTKDENNKETKKDAGPKQKKRHRIILDSDSDEDSVPSKVKKSENLSVRDKGDKHSKERKEKKDAKDSKSKLKPVNVTDVFGTSQVKRTVTKAKEKEEASNNIKLLLENEHSDSDFEATLRQLDEQELGFKKDSDFEATLRQLDEQELGFKKEKKHIQDIDKEKKYIQDKDKEKKYIQDKDKEKKHIQDKDKEKKHVPYREKEKKQTPAKEKQNKDKTSETRKSSSELCKLSPTKNNIKDHGIKPKSSESNENILHSKSKNEEEEIGQSSKTSLSIKKTEKGKSGEIRYENEHNRKEENKHNYKEDDSISSPSSMKRKLDDSFSDDAFEKKRQHAIQYQKYLHREGPKNPGGKEIPKGKPGCLSGLAFVITGVLETIDREQASSLIQQYGGRVTTSISRNTSYLVVGDEPGPSKVEKAMKFNTKQLTEDGLFNLIQTRPGTSEGSKVSSHNEKKKNNKKNHNEDKSIKTHLNDSGREHLTEVPKIVKTEDKPVPEIKQKVQLNSRPQSSSSSLPKACPVGGAAGGVSLHQLTSSLWADKYKPNSIKQIIGQQGDRSNVKKLLKWLENWHSNHSGKKKLVRPSPWAKDDSGAFFKAALLSGSPGVGKTTSAHLVCKELGFDIVEFNASDTRSKKLLHEEVTELLSSKSLSGYFQGSAGAKPTEKHVLIMDEVDGMAGNEDRGGIQELIQLIKNSRVPIICMCNDRHHPKIRSLTNYCFDLSFSKPRLEQIRGAMMSICFKEGIKISPEALNDIITGANNDVRQVLHHLSMWSVKNKHLSVEQAKEESQKAKKNIKLGPWDVLRKVFSAEGQKTMSIYDKSDLFFHDYSLGPLFVQENYLSVMPHKARGNKNKYLELVAETACSLSTGDLVEKSIRSKNAWSLLPMQAMFSSVIPGDIMSGHLMSQINFPAWLGKNSRTNKFQRLLQELQMHMRLSISGSREAVNLDYLMHIRDSIANPLIKEGAEGIPSTLSVMQNYYLMREDIDSILELSLWPNQKDPMSMIDSKVKAALTRTYNKEGILTPYSIVNVKKGATKASQDLVMDIDGEDVVDEEEEEKEDITNDAMIKAKKRPASSRDASTSSGAKGRKTDNKGTKKDGKGTRGRGKTK